MRFLALVSGIVYILLSRSSSRPQLAELPKPAESAEPAYPLTEQIRSNRECFIRDLLDQGSEAGLDPLPRTERELQPLHKAYELLKTVATGLVADDSENRWPDLQPDVDFAYKLAVIIATIKKHYGLHVEPSSIGAQLFWALEGEDYCKVADMRQRILSDTRGATEEDKSHYLFFLFWPERYSLFMRGAH